MARRTGVAWPSLVLARPRVIDAPPVVGVARCSARTKDLLQPGCLAPGSVVFLDHRDMDEATAMALAATRPAAVVNAAPTLSGEVPVEGACRLLEHGVIVLDEAGPGLLQRITSGQRVRIVGDSVLSADGRTVLARGVRLTQEAAQARLRRARAHLERHLLAPFLENTLAFAWKEREQLLAPLDLPPLRTRLAGRPVVVVVRGRDYQEDLQAIRHYIDDVRPILIGVDGGADALLAAGLPPDLIVGDMDSVSDRALHSGAELVVQAYPDGRSPGLARLRRLGLFAHVFRCPGTSEDMAMLLAYHAGAVLLVAVGTHRGVVDFLEKGRPGMASTVLVRIQVGHLLVDARGLSRLYVRPRAWRPSIWLTLAALLPLLAASQLSGPLRGLMQLLWLRVRVAVWSGGWP